MAEKSKTVKDRLNELGERWPPLGLALGVQDRVGEIRGGLVASGITLTLFISIFPLLLVGIAVVGFLASGNENLPNEMIDKLGLTGAAADTMTTAIERASQSKQAASIIGLLGLAWAGSAVAVALQQAVRSPWQRQSVGIASRLLGMAWLAAAAIGFVIAVALGGVLNFLPEQVPHLALTVAALALGLAIEIGLFWWMFWGLGTREVPARDLVPGAVVAGLGFEVLKLLGTLWVPRLVARSSSLYGPLGVVFALLAWLVLFSKLVVYAATLNAVRYERREGTVEATILVPAVPGRVVTETTRAGVVVDQTSDPDPKDRQESDDGQEAQDRDESGEPDGAATTLDRCPPPSEP